MAGSETREQPEPRDPGRDRFGRTLNLVAIGVALLVAAVQLYLGLAPAMRGSTPAAPSVLVGLLLLAVAGSFFTERWHYAAYLVLAFLGSYVGVVWLLGRTLFEPLSLVSGVGALVLFLLSIGLFFREQGYFG